MLTSRNTNRGPVAEASSLVIAAVLSVAALAVNNQRMHRRVFIGQIGRGSTHPRVLSRRVLTAGVAIISMCALCVGARADVINYISATRSVSTFHQYPAPLPNFEAIGTNGFQDFQEQQLVHPEYNFNGLILDQGRLRTYQSSRFLPDRIEANCFAETAVTAGILIAANALSASSLLEVRFSVDAPTPYALYLPIADYQRLGGGVGGAALRDEQSGQYVFALFTSSPTQYGTLLPGEYTLRVQAVADSRRIGIITPYSVGPAQAVATLVLPSPTNGAVLVVAMGVLGVRRRSV